MDAKFPRILDGLASRKDISEESKAKLLGKNGARLLKLGI